MFFRTLILGLLISTPAMASSYDSWLNEFVPRAKKAGIPEFVVRDALQDYEPDDRIIELDQKQPEQKLTMDEYLANVINDERIAKGKALLQENKKLLSKISETFGVEPEYIVALWGLETSYGKNTGGFRVIPALATLAYDGRRRDFFEKELINAFKIVDGGNITVDKMKGSWAGAMGQCQFMPSSYLKYAIDYNNDGKKDIWGTRQDVFASIANYLFSEGWGNSKEAKEKTLMHWNRSTYFVASVLKLAEEIKQ